MKKRIFILLLLAAVTVILASINVVKINDFLYPASILKQSDSSVEIVKCLQVIDENTIKVEFVNLGKEELVTFLGVAEFSENIDNSYIIQMNKNNLLDRNLSLSYDWKARNDSGEILAYVWLPTFTEVGGYDLLWNDLLLLNGYAEYDLMALELEKSILFSESYEYARDKKLGVWKHIETEKPFDFNNLPASLQAYIVDKYERGFERDVVSSDASSVSAAPDSQTTSDFLKELMVGAEWGMTPGELEQAVSVSKVDGRYEGSLLEQSWNFYFDYEMIYGSGENKGQIKSRLNEIRYTLRGDYDNTQSFAIFEKIRDIFVTKFGEPSKINRVNNIYDWELTENSMIISLRPSYSAYYGGSVRFSFEYIGELNF